MRFARALPTALIVMLFGLSQVRADAFRPYQPLPPFQAQAQFYGSQDYYDAHGGNPRDYVVDIFGRYGRDQVAAPQPDIEACVLGAEEPDKPERPRPLAAERQQEQGLLAGIETDDDERCDTFPDADVMLPGCQQVEALVGGRPGVVPFEVVPERLCGAQVVKDHDLDQPAGKARGIRRNFLSI